MIAKEWILRLHEEGILIEGVKNERMYLHLKTPCEIHLTSKVIQQLKDSYEANREKGGVLVAIPKRENGITYLTIDQVLFLTNVSPAPHNSYLPDTNELSQALTDTFSGQIENSLPIRFHTHPTHSDNQLKEMLNYIYQCNTSGQDQLVSDCPVSFDGLNVLMPRTLVLCSGKLIDKMFIGFYNGLISPIEFEGHREEQIQKAMNTIFNHISKWAEDGKNKWWLICSGIVLTLLIIRYNKFALPLILMLVLMSSLFVNDQQERSKYFAQVESGKVIIDIP